MTRIRFFIVLALLGIGAILATRGTADPDVSLSSLVELWSDALRDADQVGMKLTRVSDAEEMRIGSDLARGISETEDGADTAYVKGVAQPLLAHVRRQGIRYEFHVIESPQINAFALPGGQIFVMRGLLDFVTNESELAGVRPWEERSIRAGIREWGAIPVGQVRLTVGAHAHLKLMSAGGGFIRGGDKRPGAAYRGAERVARRAGISGRSHPSSLCSIRSRADWAD